MSDPVYDLKKLACLIPNGFCLHPDQAKPFVVKINPDANKTYAADPRWDEVSEREREYGTLILNKIVGNEYIVKRADYTGKTISYTLHVNPKVNMFDVFGVPQEMKECFIPADYVKVVRPAFPESK